MRTLYEHEGRLWTVAGLARHVGVPWHRLWRRLVLRGLPVAEAILPRAPRAPKPPRTPRKRLLVTYRGVTASLHEHVARAGGVTTYGAAYGRLRAGWSIEAAVETPVQPPKWRREVDAARARAA